MKRWKMVSMLILLLAACTPTPTTTPDAPRTTSPLPTPTEQASPTATPPASASRLISLRLWIPDLLDGYQEPEAVLNEQLTSFSRLHPDIQVLTFVKKDTGAGGIYDLLDSAYNVAPAILPDLIIINQHDLKLVAAEELILPLEDTPLPEEDFYDFALASVSVKGQPYGWPYVAQAQQMGYRAGVSATPPLSWTAILSGSYSLLFPANPPAGLASDTLLAMYLGSGGSVIGQEGQPALERDVLEQLYGFFFDLIQYGLINKERARTLPDATASWETYLEGISRLSPAPMGLYWATAPAGTIPSWAPTREGAPITIVRSWGIALVTTDPQRQEAARKLASWLVSPRRMANLTLETLLVPTRREGVANWALSPEDTAFVNELLAHSVSAPPPQVDTAVRQALQAGLTALLQDEVQTPEEAASVALTQLRR